MLCCCCCCLPACLRSLHPGHCPQTLRLLTNPTLMASSSWLTNQLHAVNMIELLMLSKAPSCRSHVPLQPLVFPHLVKHSNHLQAQSQDAALRTQHVMPWPHISVKVTGMLAGAWPANQGIAIARQRLCKACTAGFAQHAQLPINGHLLPAIPTCVRATSFDIWPCSRYQLLLQQMLCHTRQLLSRLLLHHCLSLCSSLGLTRPYYVLH
jgi:hypothetical protein